MHCAAQADNLPGPRTQVKVKLCILQKSWAHDVLIIMGPILICMSGLLMREAQYKDVAVDVRSKSVVYPHVAGASQAGI